MQLKSNGGSTSQWTLRVTDVGKDGTSDSEDKGGKEGTQSAGAQTAGLTQWGTRRNAGRANRLLCRGGRWRAVGAADAATRRRRPRRQRAQQVRAAGVDVNHQDHEHRMRSPLILASMKGHHWRQGPP